MEHLYKIYPNKNKFISGILPNRKQLIEPTLIKGLNRREFLRCMSSGEVYAVVDGVEIPIIEHDFNKAEALFKKTKKPYMKPEIIIKENKNGNNAEEIGSVNDNDTEGSITFDDTIVEEDPSISASTLENIEESTTVTTLPNATEDDLVSAVEYNTYNVTNIEIKEDSFEMDTDTENQVNIVLGEIEDEPITNESVSVTIDDSKYPSPIAKPSSGKNKYHGKHYNKNQNTQSNYSNQKKKNY